MIFAKPSLFQIFLMVCQLKCERLQILDSRLTIIDNTCNVVFLWPCDLPVSCARVINAGIATAGISEVVIGQSGMVNGRRSETGCLNIGSGIRW